MIDLIRAEVAQVVEQHTEDPLPRITLRSCHTNWLFVTHVGMSNAIMIS